MNCSNCGKELVKLHRFELRRFSTQEQAAYMGEVITITRLPFALRPEEQTINIRPTIYVCPDCGKLEFYMGDSLPLLLELNAK